VITGGMATALKEIKNGEATFERTYTGGLSDLGSMVLSLKPDGIRATSSTMGKLTDNGYELPGDLSTGKTWRSESQGEAGGKTIKITQKFTVVGVQKVKTKRAEYPDAIYITSSGPTEMDGVKSTMSSKFWYVKGRGPVKTEMTIMKNGKPVILTIQESAAGKS
jgi:hypothetical protein